MVTATVEKVLRWGVQRQGAKIDEGDSHGSFDHSYSAKIYWIYALNIRSTPI